MRNFFRSIEPCEHTARVAQYGLAAGLLCGNIILQHGIVRICIEASSHYINGRPAGVHCRPKRAIRAIEVADPNDEMGPYEVAEAAWAAIEALSLADEVESTRDWLHRVACIEALEAIGCDRRGHDWCLGYRCFGEDPIVAWEIAKVC